ncbi:MAG: hypothetical protein ACK5XA_15750 [Tagaea sp.]
MSRNAVATQLRGLGLEPRVVQAIEELQRAVRFGTLNQTAVDQVNALISSGGSGGSGGPGTPPGGGGDVIDTSPPPALTGFEATGGYGIVFLNWDFPTDPRHGLTEVWRSTTNNVGTAVQIGTAAGSIYVDVVQNSSTFYYWVRAVNKWDNAVKSAFTPNTTGGLPATSAPDVPYLLDALTGAITASELTSALNTRINLIDAGAGTPGSVDARILNESNTRVAEDDALATSIAALAVSSDSGFDWARIWYFDTTIESWTSNGGAPTVSGGLLRAFDHATDPQLISPAGLAIAAATFVQVKARIKRTGTPTWDGRLYWRRTGDSTWDTGRSVTVAEPTWSGGFGTVTFEPDWDGTIDLIRLDLGTESDATNRHELDWAAIGRSAPGASTAMVANVETTKIGYCTVSGLATDQTNKAACEAAGGTWNVGLPIATAVKQVAVNDGAGSVALEERFVAQKTLDDGLKAQWTLKVDANGRVGGIGLAATSSAPGVGTIDFAVRADKFWIAAPGGTDLGVIPFTVLTSPTVINGDTIPPGTYIADAFIRNAAIDSAKIKDAAITNAKIVSLTADKVTLDSLVGRLAQITTGDFQTIFADKAFITQAMIGQAAIGSANITDFIQSSNYGPTTGWRIDVRGPNAGSAIFRNLTVTDAQGNVILAAGGGIPWGQIIGAQSFYDTFSTIGRWADQQGAGAEISIAQVPDAVSGSTVLRIGNGAGDDYAYMMADNAIPFSSTTLYRCRARVRRVSGSGTVFLGFAGVGANNALVNLNGANDLSNQHYFGAAGVNPASTWTVYEGYFRGYGINGGPGTAIAPWGVHPSVRWMRPIILANFFGAAGITEIDEFEITAVDGALGTVDQITASNASTFIANGAIGTLQIADQIFSNDWVSSGGSAGWIINKDGSARFNNVTVRGLVTASLVASEDFSRYLDFRPGTPSGHLLFSPSARILADGSTRFNNLVAAGVHPLNGYPMNPGDEIVFDIETGLNHIPTGDFGNFVVQITPLATGTLLAVPVGANALVGWYDCDGTLAMRTQMFSDSSGFNSGNASPNALALVVIRARVRFSSLTIMRSSLQSLTWFIYRIT